MNIVKTYRIQLKFGSEYQQKMWEDMFNTFVQSLKIMMSAKHKDNDVSITEVNT